jgi:LacI family transcriptional regulator
VNKRTTITDISKVIGVSATTVTRALNGKPRVSEGLRKEIIDMAREMGYTPNKTAQALVRGRIVIGLVYPKEPVEYFRYIENGLHQGINDLIDLKVTGIFKPASALNAINEYRRALLELYEANVDGVIISVGFGYNTYEDILKAIEAKGIPILYLLNNISSVEGIGCIRLNGVAAGKMAAQMLGLCIKNTRKNVVVITANKESFIHIECIKGFTQEAALEDLNIKGVYEAQDDKRIAYLLTEKVISEIPDLGGIYVSSYNSVSVCNCLEEHKLDKKIVVIGQDLYPELVDKLEYGSLIATLFQDPFAQGVTSVQRLYSYITKESGMGDVLTSPQLVLRSNLDCYKNKY